MDLAQVLVHGLVETIAGIAAACGGLWSEAEGHYEKALRLTRDLPHRLHQPEVQRWYAQMLVQRSGEGDNDRARELLDQSVSGFTELEMPRHVEMAQAARDALERSSSGT